MIAGLRHRLTQDVLIISRHIVLIALREIGVFSDPLPQLAHLRPPDAVRLCQISHGVKVTSATVNFGIVP